MPGNEFANKQSVLGSAAGVALLAFALAYRFLPSFSGGPGTAERPAPAPVAGAPMSVQKPAVAVAEKPAPALKPLPAETLPVTPNRRKRPPGQPQMPAIASPENDAPQPFPGKPIRQRPQKPAGAIVIPRFGL